MKIAGEWMQINLKKPETVFKTRTGQRRILPGTKRDRWGPKVWGQPRTDILVFK